MSRDPVTLLEPALPIETVPPDSPLLADAAAGWASAYVHIPFCARVCPYCDFAVVAGGEGQVERYLGAVMVEISREPEWRALDAVNFGGGTPSRIEPGDLGRVLEALADRFSLDPAAEISLEANPEDWTLARARGLRTAGFNRVSFGAQSFQPGVLSALGRRHRPEQVAQAVEGARAAGFPSVNLDLIYGTPGEDLFAWEATLETALSLKPDHLSCYALTVERGTVLQRQIASGAPAPDPDLQADQYQLAERLLAGAGLVRYEVSNWSRPLHPCRYNLAVWAQGEYLGLGMAAHRHRDGIRSHNLSRLDSYLEAIEAGRSPRRGIEQISGWSAEVERVLLGLRRRAGVVPGKAGETLLTSAEGRRLASAGVLGVQGERLVVLRPLLTDAVLRALLALPAIDC
jgi:oxygen-independent coproporphyrinogen-3 oxidase